MKEVNLKSIIEDEKMLIEFLECTYDGRLLLLNITFPIANYFKIHPEKVPIKLVVDILKNIYKVKDQIK